MRTVRQAPPDRSRPVPQVRDLDPARLRDQCHYMLADRDGVVRVPRGRVDDVLDVAEAAIGTENMVRTAILSGVDPQEAYLCHGKF